MVALYGTFGMLVISNTFDEFKDVFEFTNEFSTTVKTTKVYPSIGLIDVFKCHQMYLPLLASWQCGKDWLIFMTTWKKLHYI